MQEDLGASDTEGSDSDLSDIGAVDSDLEREAVQNYERGDSKIQVNMYYMYSHCNWSCHGLCNYDLCLFVGAHEVARGSEVSERSWPEAQTSP